MKASEAIARLQELVAKHGDGEIAYHDMDTQFSFELNPSDVRAQRMLDGSVRFAIGSLGYWTPRLDDADVDDLDDESPPDRSGV